MKKLFLTAALGLLCAVGMNAQKKKDGTPDMRYKANKQTVKVQGPTKKDGTPDMRFKSNQTTTVKAAKPAAKMPAAANSNVVKTAKK